MALEQDHGLVDGILTVGVIQHEKSLLQPLHDHPHLAQPVIPRIPTWVEIFIVAEVEEATDLPKLLSGNPVYNGTVVQEWMSPPVVVECREMDYAHEYHEPKVSPQVFHCHCLPVPVPLPHNLLCIQVG